MSTKHTANIYITNNSGGNAIITMSHQYHTAPQEIGQWPAAPGETVGPLVVHYETGPGTWYDWWAVKMIVQDGPEPGVYTSGGSSIDPKQKECMLRDSDANQNITNTVDTKTFHINLKSGGCSTGMKKVAPYTKVTNVFVLMLENHSFDHLLGFSGIKNSTTSINGLNGESNDYTDGTSVTSYTVKEGAVDPMTTDPGHEFLDTLQQLTGIDPNPKDKYQYKNPYPAINNSGFVQDYATTTTEGPTPAPSHYGDIMACCDSSTQVSALYTLATEFAVCDTWHSSMPGPTWPNRFFAMGGSSSGLDDSPTKGEMFKWLTYDGFEYENGSIFDLLYSKGYSFRLYNDWSDQFRPGWTTYLGGGEIPIVAALKNINIFDVHSLKHFANDLKGPYPHQFTFIEPNYGDIVLNTYKHGSSQHPMDSLTGGDQLVALVYDAIRNSPLWDTSMLIITYDEHGGFYDHVPPPTAIAPGDKPPVNYSKHGFDFTQYGIRVPAVVVSPLIPQNTIDHTLYDHTSILRTVEELWDLGHLTARDLNANSLMPLLSLETARTDCPTSVTPSTEPAAAPRMEMDEAQLAASRVLLEAAPLPEQGNVNGSLFVALKADLDMSDGSDTAKAAIMAKVEAIQTRGEASDYINEVMTRVNAAKDAKAAAESRPENQKE